MLYILTSVWVLPTGNAVQSMLLNIFHAKKLKRKKSKKIVANLAKKGIQFSGYNVVNILTWQGIEGVVRLATLS